GWTLTDASPGMRSLPVPSAFITYSSVGPRNGKVDLKNAIWLSTPQNGSAAPFLRSFVKSPRSAPSDTRITWMFPNGGENFGRPDVITSLDPSGDHVGS